MHLFSEAMISGTLIAARQILLLLRPLGSANGCVVACKHFIPRDSEIHHTEQG